MANECQAVCNGRAKSTDTAGFLTIPSPQNGLYQNRSPFSYLDTHFDTRTYRNGCPFLLQTCHKTTEKYLIAIKTGSTLTYQPCWSLFSYIPVQTPPNNCQMGCKKPPRDVKSNDSHPPHVRCVSPCHPRTQTSSPRRGGRWRALP